MECPLCAWLDAPFVYRAIGDLGHCHGLLHKALSWAFPGVEALAEASAGGAEGPLTPQTFTPRNPLHKEAQGPK